ncbi:flavodoxin [uncultured Bacteroides sp.]|uniref:flavodoxin n=1 Tax=uncultured Bacteroides sp. TaxID=162156 RepID=UPI0025E5169E|nr:flavodoxin [uncultured Bacteroides sp.]
METTSLYPVDFNDVCDLNHAKQAAETLPALKKNIDNMNQYEVILIGYPVWATDVPQAILSFLSAYNLSGRTVVPFCTHDVYGAGSSYRSVQSAASRTNVLEGIAINSTNVPSSEAQIKS